MRIALFNLLALGLVMGLAAACQPNAAPPTADAVDITQPVPLAVGQSQDLSGSLKSNETIHFLLTPQAGQLITVELEGTDVQMVILDQDGKVIEERAGLSLWRGMAAYSGQYFVRLSPAQAAENSEYTVRLSLEAR
jgi:hypothetical protein